MPKKIDPLNRKMYGAVSILLCVKDIKASASFYQKAFGFERRGIMNGPDGKPMHAELRLRDTTLMLGPESAQMNARSASSIGGTPATLYLLSENVDKTVAKAEKLGAKVVWPVMDMFWGDRCATIVDPEGNPWMIATHMSEPTPQEMKAAMKKMMASAPKASE